MFESFIAWHLVLVVFCWNPDHGVGECYRFAKGPYFHEPDCHRTGSAMWRSLLSNKRLKEALWESKVMLHSMRAVCVGAEMRRVEGEREPPCCDRTRRAVGALDSRSEMKFSMEMPRQRKRRRGRRSHT